MELSDILSLVLSFLMLVTTVLSVRYAIKAYQHQKERTRKEAACNLAKVYAEEILDKCVVVTMILDKSKILEFVKENFPMSNIKNFTMDEVLDFVTKKRMDFKTLHKKMYTFDADGILSAIEAGEVPSLSDKPLSLVSKSKEALDSYVKDTISSLLNTLEWFSMNCHYGLADEKILYQSLHQTFLSTVWMLYYYISMNNVANVDKYYTNIIWLFTVWESRAEEETARYLEDMRTAKEEIRAVKEKVANAGRIYEGKSL